MLMKTQFLFTVIVCISSAPLTPEEKRNIDNFVNRLLQCKGIPGASVAAVRDGKVVLAEGYGVADLETRRKVTADTMFNIASVSKQFTALLLSKQLSESPGINWETPVRNMLEEDFHFSTGYRTNHTNLRDLLSHKTGIPRHDFAWLLEFVDREQFMRNLRFYDPVYDLRSSWVYTNSMFTLAGKVSEALAGDGRTWEDLIYSEFFLGLGMTSSGFVHEIGDESHRFATSYWSYNNTAREVDFEVTKTFGIVAPAGGISSNANDMAKWLNFLMSGKGLDGLQIMDMKDIEAIWKLDSMGQGLQDRYNPVLKPKTPVTLANTGYGKGIFTGYYRDYRYQNHGGDTIGHHSYLGILPDKNIGVSLSFNYQTPWGREYTSMYILDTLLGETPWLNTSWACENTDDSGISSYASSLGFPVKGNEIPPERPSPVPMSRDILDYVGSYGHFGYGNISVVINTTTGNLHMTIGRLGFYELIHAGNDTFDLNVLGKTWYYPFYFCEFGSSGGEASPIDTVEIPLMELRGAPVFRKGLKMSDAPPPRYDNC